MTALLLLSFLAQTCTSAERFQADEASVLRYRNGLSGVMEYVRGQPDLFPAEKLPARRMLSREQKEAVWGAWKRSLDYLLALESIRGAYRGSYRLPAKERGPALSVAYAAFLAQYRWSLDFIERADNDPDMDVILNEPVPELGLGEGAYRRLKFRFLNVAAATEFAAYQAMAKAFSGKEPSPLQKGIEEDAARIWLAGEGRGETLTLKNGLSIVKNLGLDAWFPVQAGVSEWMGDVKVYRQSRSLISPKQIEGARKHLEPGDILLVRREWYLSNVGLPGFWPHGAIYIGTPEERKNYFGDAFEAELASKEPKNYADGLKPYHGHPPRVLEAMSEGVSFTSLEHSIDADSMVALRPRLDKREKAQAILRAFHHAGKPYDFDFDFRTDDALVCTELVYKSYEPAGGMKGLKFPMAEIAGRPTLPANLIAKQFDEEASAGAPQFDFVLFLDGYEKSGKAVESDVEEFRKSWRRPKWHVLVQQKPD